MSISTIVVILLILMLVGAFPGWRHSRDWGLWAQRWFGLGRHYLDCAVGHGAYLTWAFSSQCIVGWGHVRPSRNLIDTAHRTAAYSFLLSQSHNIRMY